MRTFASLLLLPLLLTGCAQNSGPAVDASHRVQLLSVAFNDPVSFAARAEGISLQSARNETVSFAAQVNNLPSPQAEAPAVLRMQALRLKGAAAAEDQIDVAQLTPYQLLFMPVDLNRAAFVRHTGIEEASARELPRALLPVAVDGGKINLAGLRDPDRPRDATARPAGHSTRPIMLWFDLAVPPTAKPGDYQTTFEILQRGAVVSTLVVTLHVDDFVLPDERHLQIVGQLDWTALIRLYPSIFETARPWLMKRDDPRVAQAVAILDQIVKLGQQHRAQVVIPELRPVVKWPPGQPPSVDWSDFDSLVMPWLTGEAFADKVPLGYWPLPEAASLRNIRDLQSRLQYWKNATAHFAQRNLLNHSPIIVQKIGADAQHITPADYFRLSEEAAQLLTVNPNVRVTVPLEDQQVQFVSSDNGSLIDPRSANRLLTVAPGLVFREASSDWPKGTPEPSRWLAADKPGLVPFAGAGGDERDVRLWASLAFLRRAELVQWPDTLPNYDNPDQPADPNDVIWFYPGQWFGVDQPVPTVHLKWIRRAQQDYEYLFLARARGELTRTLVIARLITKPVLIPIAQTADPAYALLCGATDMKSWQEAKQLLAESILLRPPGVEKDPAKETDLNGRTLQWAVPQEKPLLMARRTRWGWDANQSEGPTVDLRLSVDMYNAADERLMGQLQWSTAPDAWAPGWQINPQATVINPANAINTYHVRRFDMDIAIRLDELSNAANKPLPLMFTNELTAQTTNMQTLAPVAPCDRHDGSPLRIDGDLRDWSQGDALQNGPMVRMLNGPAVQKQQIERAKTPSKLYSAWTDDRFFFAFALQGCEPITGGAQTNYVEYRLGRAWGEDLAELLMQAVYADGSAGPVLHIVVKPRGGTAVERKPDPKQSINPWESVAGEQILYGSTFNPPDPVWRGEIAVPWSAINDARHGGAHPMLLRFNFSQHKNATGESASWAGPIDSGRDESFTGLLYLRDASNPNRAPQ